MKLEAMMRYVEPGNLLIVGNRYNVHRISLQRGAAVLSPAALIRRKK